MAAIFLLPASAGAQDKQKTYGGRIEWFKSPVSGREGGVKAAVVDRNGRAPIQGAVVELYQGSELVAKAELDESGQFLFSDIDNGDYRLVVNAPGFNGTEVNVKVEGFVRDLVFVSLVSAQKTMTEFDESSFMEFDMEDSGYDDAPSLLYGNDVYSNIAGYGFSAIRFKNRGIFQRIAGCISERCQDERCRHGLYSMVPVERSERGYEKQGDYHRFGDL